MSATPPPRPASSPHPLFLPGTALRVAFETSAPAGEATRFSIGDDKNIYTNRRYTEFAELFATLAKRAKDPSQLPALPGKLFLHTASALEARRAGLEVALNRAVDLHRESPPAVLVRFLGLDSAFVQQDEGYSVVSSHDGLAESVIAAEEDEEEEEEDWADAALASAEEEWDLDELVSRASGRGERNGILEILRVSGYLSVCCVLLSSMLGRKYRAFWFGSAFGSAILAGFAQTRLWTRHPNGDTNKNHKRKTSQKRIGVDFGDSKSDASDVAAFLNHRRRQAERDAPSDPIASSPASSSPAVANPYEAADRLADAGQYEEAYAALLDVPNVSDPQWVWRRARFAYYLAGLTSNSGTRRVELLSENVASLREALNEHDDIAMLHKWFAILRSAQLENGGLTGTRARLESGLDFQKHTLRAIELAPNDATLHYMLGRFCYDVSRLTWIEIRAARALFGRDPPVSSYAEALSHFERAIEIRPAPLAWVEAARCRIAMGESSPATKELLEKCVAWSNEADRVVGTEDQRAIDVAKGLLREMNN